MKRRAHAALHGALPAVRRSFVVEIASTEGDSGGITARIQPIEQADAALVAEGFRLSDSVFDLVSELLVEIAREEEEEDDT